MTDMSADIGQQPTEPSIAHMSDKGRRALETAFEMHDTMRQRAEQAEAEMSAAHGTIAKQAGTIEALENENNRLRSLAVTAELERDRAFAAKAKTDVRIANIRTLINSNDEAELVSAPVAYDPTGG